MITKRFFQILLFVWGFCSCKGQPNNQESCIRKFKQAQDIAYGNPNRPSTLDSALSLTNDIMGCDSIRKAVVEFKINLLITLQQYSKALSFVDSSNSTDFTYNYKKNLTYRSIQALAYDSKGDKGQRDSIYKILNNELEAYIKNQTPLGKEFKEIYTELFAVKRKYQDSKQTNVEAEILKNKYPEYQSFFEFFKEDSSTQ